MLKQNGLPEEFPCNLEKWCLNFSLDCIIRGSLWRSTPWVLGFELCNWVSLKGQKLGKIVSIRKNVWGVLVVMATDLVQSTV